jgi:hypothetical protein
MPNARVFLLDYLRRGPSESFAVYEAVHEALDLAGPQITAELLALNVDVFEHDGQTMVALPRNLFAIWWARSQPLRSLAGTAA